MTARPAWRVIVDVLAAYQGERPVLSESVGDWCAGWYGGLHHAGRCAMTRLKFPMTRLDWWLGILLLAGALFWLAWWTAP